MKLLVVENDADLAEKVENFLKTEGHRCEIYTSPAPALAAATTYYYDSIIFNLTSLDQEELDLLKFLRSSHLNKKAILTFEQNNAVNQNKVDALHMTSLQKPYALQALHTQLNALLHYENVEDSQTLFFKELIIDVPGRVVRVKDQVIHLTRLEHDLLLYFVSNKDKVLSKNALAQYLASNNATETSDFGFLYAHVKNLKKKLKAAGAAGYINTVYGVGYRFSL